jgi:hypothetical protein
MSSGRAAKLKNDQAFTRRTVAAMVSEMVEARARMNRVCVQFEALATANGVKVDWDNTSV